MADWAPFLAAAGAAAAGILLLITLQRLMTDGVRVYERRVIGSLGKDLRNAFVSMSPARLLFLSLIAVAGAGALGSVAGGWIAGVAAALFTGVLPPWLWHRYKDRRTRRFVLQLPDCLNAMSSSLRGGCHLSRAMELAAAQQPVPVSQELSVVLSEYRLGRDLDDALGDMAARVRCGEVVLLNAAINIARTVGGNLADTLDNLAETLREKAQVEGKIEALTAMGKMQGWVVASLPFFLAAVLYKQEPRGMRALLDEPLGWATLGVLLVMLSVAVLMIRRIVRIDV